MDKEAIDLERVVHDAEYRRTVIEKLKAKASTATGATTSKPAATDAPPSTPTP